MTRCAQPCRAITRNKHIFGRLGKPGLLYAAASLGKLAGTSRSVWSNGIACANVEHEGAWAVPRFLRRDRGSRHVPSQTEVRALIFRCMLELSKIKNFRGDNAAVRVE